MSEEILKFEIPKHVVTNLLLFLKKTPLIGEEVPAYVEIINTLGKAKSDETTKT